MVSSEKKGFIIGIGNPIIDISNDTTKESIDKYGLAFGQTIFANDSNIGFYDELEKAQNCSYVPGGSVTNSIRVSNWMFNKNPNLKSALIGCVGKDEYGDRIILELKKVGVDTRFLQIDDKELSSRCACGIFKKDRCLMPQIRASAKLSKQFVEENLSSILEADILFVEGYFVIDCYDIVLLLVKKFKEEGKKVAFTLSAVFMIQVFWDRIKEVADLSDIVFCNEEEAIAFVEKLGKTPVNDEENAKIILNNNKSDKIVVITCGKNPVILSQMKDSIITSIKSEVNTISVEEIVDTNGCGDAFVGGFMSEYLKGSDLSRCGEAGNYASSVIIRHIGCTHPETPEFK